MEIPIVKRDNGIPVIRVQIAASAATSLEMAVDTGASSSAITTQVAQQIKAREVGTATVGGATGTCTMPVVKVAVTVESLTKILHCSVNPNLPYGLIGHDFFGDRDIVVRQNVIELRDRKQPQQPKTEPKQTEEPLMSGRKSPSFSNIRISPKYLTWLGWAVTVAIAFFAYLNIGPYEASVRMLFSSAELSGLAKFLMELPLVGFLVTGATNLFSWMMGTVLWFILQTLELLPLLLFNSRKALRAVIHRSSSADVFEVKDTDDPALASLKKAYNKLPYRIVRQFRQASLFAYTVDLLICCMVYPPIENGGIQKLILILSTGAFELINWRNVLLLLVTLFSVEVLLQIAFMVSNLRAALTGGEVNEQQV